MESGVDWPDGVLLSPAVVTVTWCDFYGPANNGFFSCHCFSHNAQECHVFLCGASPWLESFKLDQLKSCLL